ncbi:patatin-like phospholipase family protein [Paraburkholderia sp. BCC1884]|uniref:patatin-like phospholipase family protein n=1 Tax=Paraburkholderia sp. BCC1884 TaxID=2562668 RepID=UPI0011823B06|nr:patatin-like phospholipase family protein [Paraburkholderia sp. BCC1884]
MSSITIALSLVASLLLGACATRAINPPIVKYESHETMQFEKLERNRGDPQDLVVLAFSGGGTRAAAFSYGVLEALRRTEIVDISGERSRLLDSVDVITGVSGGSFTALAYGLYGEKLFDIYEKSFLKRNVQGELVSRVLNPLNWAALSSKGWGRSDLAAQLYDEILFKGATFDDLNRANGPAIAVSATELTTGSRLVFLQQNFDVMCADLGPIRLSRAAAASSAVPVVLSPITINNYGGTCGYHEPEWIRRFTDTYKPPRPAGRVLKRLQELREFSNAEQDPYFHLVDGGVSDNLGLRGVLDFIETFEALRAAGKPTPIDNVRRFIIFVVNSVSSPANKWNQSENPPGSLDILTKAAGVPIDRYSSESVELLKDIDARWTALRELRDSAGFANSKDPKPNYIANAPNADIYVIDVSFQALKDKTEYDYLNQLPTSFHLPDEAVDRLRAAAGKLILDSPDFQQMLKDAGARVADESVSAPSAMPVAK